MATTHRELYDKQISLLTPETVDRLVDEQYTEDAVLLRADGNIVGREALRAYFPGYLSALGGITLLSTDLFLESEDVVAFEATVETGAYGKVRVYDTWLLRDGKIARHVTGTLA